MSEMYLRQPAVHGKSRFTNTLLAHYLLKTKKEHKNLKKQEIHNIFIKTK